MSEEHEWEKKCWGWTRLEFQSEATTRHELLVEAGGYCSFHLHKKRWNRFRVVSGEILVVQLHGSTILVTKIAEGGIYDIAPNICHQFQVTKSGRVIEAYWNEDGTPPDVLDIERFTTGGTLRNRMDMKLFGEILDENQNVLHLKWGIKQ